MKSCINTQGLMFQENSKHNNTPNLHLSLVEKLPNSSIYFTGLAHRQPGLNFFVENNKVNLAVNDYKI